MKKAFTIVPRIVGILGTILVVIKITRNYATINLTGIPEQIYIAYLSARDSFFDVAKQVLFDWWTIISIPDPLKDVISLYLFFGLSLLYSKDQVDWIYKFVLRAGTVRLGSSPLSKLEQLLISIRRTFFWPVEFIRYIWGWANFRRNNQPGPTLSNPRKEQLLKMQYNLELAGMLSYPFTLAIVLIGAVLFFIWNYLQKI